MLRKKIAILCVNYNSYNELSLYLSSIIEASRFYKLFVVDVFIGDNSTNASNYIQTPNSRQVAINLFPYKENLGYLGAIMRLIKDIGYKRVTDYDYLIISNVDLTVTKSFFKDLSSLRINPDIGWIAPKIISSSELRDRNPKILHRPSLMRINLLIFMFKYPFVYHLYEKTVYRYKSKTISNDLSNMIYAGHGSFMIFTKVFMENHASFNFPSFLFGEELFFGELARSSKLKVLYAPDIVVNDSDHVSTSKLKRKTYCKMNYESLKKLKPFFVNE